MGGLFILQLAFEPILYGLNGGRHIVNGDLKAFDYLRRKIYCYGENWVGIGYARLLG
jgi:hypothetical protein